MAFVGHDLEAGTMCVSFFSLRLDYRAMEQAQVCLHPAILGVNTSDMMSGSPLAD